RRRWATDLPAGTPTTGPGPKPGRSGARSSAGDAPSGAVSAQHLLLVRQLSTVLHQEASLADEFRFLDRDHTGIGRIGRQLVVLREGQQDLVLIGGPRPLLRVLPLRCV